MSMLRRASLDIDVNRINMAGMTALHQAVLDANIVVIRLLLLHGADINKRDADSWTPLHAASANGATHIVKYLLSQGADRELETSEGEEPVNLVDPEDFETMAVLTEKTQDTIRKQSVQEGRKVSAAWFRRESLQEERKWSLLHQDPVRKCSALVQEVLVEEEEKEYPAVHQHPNLKPKPNLIHHRPDPSYGELNSHPSGESTNFSAILHMSTPGSPSAVSLNTNPSLGVHSGPICGKPGKSEHDGGEPVVDSGDNIVQQLQGWRTRRKGRLELTHPTIELS